MYELNDWPDQALQWRSMPVFFLSFCDWVTKRVFLGWCGSGLWRGIWVSGVAPPSVTTQTQPQCSISLYFKMRNLLAIERSVVRVSSTEVPDLPLTAVAWDPAADSLICTHGPSVVEALIELKRVTVRFDSIQELIVFLFACCRKESHDTDCERLEKRSGGQHRVVGYTLSIAYPAVRSRSRPALLQRHAFYLCDSRWWRYYSH